MTPVALRRRGHGSHVVPVGRYSFAAFFTEEEEEDEELSEDVDGELDDVESEDVELAPSEADLDELAAGLW